MIWGYYPKIIAKIGPPPAPGEEVVTCIELGIVAHGGVHIRV